MTAPLSNLLMVRFLIKDQNTLAYLFTDDELETLLALNHDDVYMSAADACFALAADANKKNLMVKIVNYSKDARGITREYRRMGEDFKLKAENEPALAVAVANEAISSFLGVQ